MDLRYSNVSNMRVAILLMLSVCGVRAEFLHIQVSVRDMNCESCSESLGSIFKRMRGVENVDIDYQAATIRLDLAAQNRISVEQVWDAIKRVGFTPGSTKVDVRGVVGERKIEVREANKTYRIEGRAADGEVELKGTTEPPPDPRTPVVIRVE
jgi:copper chaperone CopZ